MPNATVSEIEAVQAAVRDAEETADDFLRLGFRLAWRSGGGSGWRSSGVCLGAADLEFVSPGGDGSPRSHFFEAQLERHGEGLFQLGFRADDIDAAVARLRAGGIEAEAVSSDSMRSGEPHENQFRIAIPRSRIAGLRAFIVEWQRRRPRPIQREDPLKIKKLDHVVIATADLDDALAQWERNVGLTPDASLDQPLGSGFRVSRLPIGESFLELVQPVEEKGRFYEQFQERGEGLFSVSIEVEDLDAAVAHLRGKSAKVSDPEPSIWPGARLARVNHNYTHGVSIQLIERK
jgi:catechol 2,3-dioxygenase-like lactoylglutathione lyase family enzyme